VREHKVLIRTKNYIDDKEIRASRGVESQYHIDFFL
jgi:hypothetical protein